MHEYEDPRFLARKISWWLKNHDGTHVLLADKTEAGRVYIPDRGFDLNTNTVHGEYTPEHVHHDYPRTPLYAVGLCITQTERTRGPQGRGSWEGTILRAGQVLRPGQVVIILIDSSLAYFIQVAAVASFE